VHAAQKDDDMPSLEMILAPLEAEIKLNRTEVSPGISAKFLPLQCWNSSLHEAIPFMICYRER
jgi:hypothetical protein